MTNAIMRLKSTKSAGLDQIPNLNLLKIYLKLQLLSFLGHSQKFLTFQLKLVFFQLTGN